MTTDPTDIDRLTPPELVPLEEPPETNAGCIEFLPDVLIHEESRDSLRDAETVEGVRDALTEAVSQ